MSQYVASWPILDPAIPLADLINEATEALPELQPKGYRLHDHHWTVDGDRLILTADARPIDACINGHEWTPENTVRRAPRYARRCRTCHNTEARERRRRSATREPIYASKGPGGRYLPAEPLLRVLDTRPDVALSVADGRAISRARGVGRLREEVADRIACRLGLHPCLIWSEWFEIDEEAGAA